MFDDRVEIGFCRRCRCRRRGQKRSIVVGGVVVRIVVLAENDSDRVGWYFGEDETRGLEVAALEEKIPHGQVGVLEQLEPLGLVVQDPIDGVYLATVLVGEHLLLRLLQVAEHEIVCGRLVGVVARRLE